MEEKEIITNESTNKINNKPLNNSLNNNNNKKNNSNNLQLENKPDNTLLRALNEANKKKENNNNDFDLKQMQPGKAKLLKAEIYGSYTGVIKKTFVRIFNEYYSTNYDVESLLNSINFSSKNDFIPSFSCNENNFVFSQDLLNPDMNDRYNRFNKNAGLTDEFVRFNDPRLGRNTARYQDKQVDDFYNKQYKESKSNTEENNESENKVTEKEVKESFDYIRYLDNTRGKMANTMTRDEGYKGLSEVYTIAKNRAKIEWDKEFNREIKNRMKKKYGIQG